jgi:hypothetical protein
VVRPLLRFDQHALARMAGRGITALEVAEAVADRDKEN